jgi:phosphoribosylformylglycinamidine synthase
MNVSVIIFPGSNCDQDIVSSIHSITKKKPNEIWYKDQIPKNTDFIILPGGFSFGDYLRSGAIASASKIIREVITFSKKGVPIMGICNGFQILTEANLLPGTLIINKNLKFICKEVYLKVVNNNCIFTHKLDNKVFKLPIAHKMGNYVATKDVLKEMIENDQIIFKYCSKIGHINDTYNPNGSINNIAGIVSLNKRIIGMMPHPERYIDINQKDIIMKQIIESIL